MPDCRRARCGKSLANTFDFVNSKPTTPGVEAVAATEDAKVKSVAAESRVDATVIVKIQEEWREVWLGRGRADLVLRHKKYKWTADRRRILVEPVIAFSAPV